jgi:uncharacterized protein YjbI with pentapeptide repeats
MKTHFIKSYKTGEVLYAGEAISFKLCVEQAVCEGVILHNADFRHVNLADANLDDARMQYAAFHGANLSGANLSEADLQGASFRNASLYNTCLAFANGAGIDFSGAHFGATDVAGAILDGCIFDTLSALSMSFNDAKTLRGCMFTASNGHTCSFDRPPAVVRGMAQPIAVFAQDTMIGHIALPHDKWRVKWAAEHCNDNGHIYSFARSHRSFIIHLQNLYDATLSLCMTSPRQMSI